MKKVKSRIIAVCVDEKKTVFLNLESYVISHVITPYITLFFIFSAVEGQG